MSEANRIALVTGGGRGIGRAIALGLAEDGADVGISWVRDEAAAAKTVGEIEKLGRRAIAVQAAVEDPDQCAELEAAVSKELGPIDVLVNNGGVASRRNPVETTDPAELEHLMRVHALGPHRLCQLVIPGMKTRERGDIVMISSAATLTMSGFGAPYNMGKAALEALAFTLAKEVRQDGIRVNVVAPGLVETEMGRRLVKATQGIEDMREIDQYMPFGRVCQPEDIANTVRFLVSDAGSYITGEKINVHAGGPPGARVR